MQEFGSIITKEYKKFCSEPKEILNLFINQNCSICNNDVPPCLKDHWIKYLKSLYGEWLEKLKEANHSKRLEPNLCYYYLLIAFKDKDLFEDHHFFKEFIALCAHNKTISLTPDFFELIYEIAYVKEKINKLTTERADEIVEQDKKGQIAIKIEHATPYIHDFLRPIISEKYLIHPQSFLPLIDTIINNDAFASEMVEGENFLNRISSHFNAKLLINILSALNEAGYIFQTKLRASTFVPFIVGKNFKSNDTKMFSQYNTRERKFSYLSKSLAEKVKNIAKNFIASQKEGK